MNLPNFFIVGGPKCGTTALSAYLRSHPAVFMSFQKEPNYFASELSDTARSVRQWDAYLGLFEPAGEMHTAIGEASASYLYSTVAIPQLLKRIPEARVIALLRNPIELAVSLHAQELSVGNENIRSFEEAWRGCEQRRQGKAIPSTCPDPKMLLYDEIPLLGGQLERALNHVPRENLHWWFHEDFSRDPGRIYREVLAFLGLPDDERQEFPRLNTRKHTRFLLLANFTQKPPKWVKRSAAWYKRFTGVKRLHLMDVVRRVNYGANSAPALSPSLIAEMRTYFAPDIRLLQTLTGRDLEHWLSDESAHTQPTAGDSTRRDPRRTV